MSTSLSRLPQLWFHRLAELWFALALVASVVLGGFWLASVSNRPIKDIVIMGDINYLDNAELNNALLDVRGRRFFEVNVHTLRAAIENTSWVRLVDIRRVWPNKLAITITEHKAIARWQDVEPPPNRESSNDNDEERRFVSDEGVIFSAPVRGEALDKLALFVGPANSAQDMLRRYLEMNQYLLPLKQKIVRLDLSPRLAWSFRLSGGMRVELGREHERVTHQQALKRFVDLYQRFVELYQQLRASRPEAPMVADLRYPNGFVLSYAKPYSSVERSQARAAVTPELP